MNNYEIDGKDTINSLDSKLELLLYNKRQIIVFFIIINKKIYL
jgi:hypothetical protein